MDLMSLIGLLTGIMALLVGQHLEGGNLGSLVNAPAILIVTGGTVGAVMLQSPMKVFLRALRNVSWVFIPPPEEGKPTIEKILAWSTIARKEGLLGLESLAETEEDYFSSKGLQLLIDGSEPEVIRRILEVDIDTLEYNDIQAAKVFEAMGGYAPTIGIIGAVMGLIQVMENLADPSRLGAGIATAFVATIYGVGLANLVLLPMAKKMKDYVYQKTQVREMLIEGVISIAEGENPRNIETKLLGYVR